MQTIRARDTQVVLILSKAEAKELRSRLQQGFHGGWTKNTLNLDRKTLDELDRIEA